MFTTENRSKISKLDKDIQKSWETACQYYLDDADYPISQVRTEYVHIIDLANAIITMANQQDGGEYSEALQAAIVQALELAEREFRKFILILLVY